MLVLVGFLWAELVSRAQAVRNGPRDRGASALEWAIIAAISVVLASVIGVVVYNVVKGKADTVQNCSNSNIPDCQK